MKTEKVMYDSPEAAQYKTVTGWVDRQGRFWGQDEHMARYCGSTHKLCPTCGSEMATNGFCDPCYNKKRAESFYTYPIAKEWDFPLVVFDTDKYLFDEDYLYDYLYECIETDTEPRLVTCTPNYCQELSYDYWEDIIPDDGGYEYIPDEILDAVDKLNIIIKQCHGKKPVSWNQGKERLSDEQIQEIKDAYADNL